MSPSKGLYKLDCACSTMALSVQARNKAMFELGPDETHLSAAAREQQH